ncbi:MAG: hypothetical protein LBT13_01175 [Treponema sp.]|nr:hypothetical protein [Treponema sp.]
MNKKIMVWPVLFLALTIGVADESRYALVIGNGDYSNVGKLANPENDARDVTAALSGLSGGFARQPRIPPDDRRGGRLYGEAVRTARERGGFLVRRAWHTDTG